MTTKPPIGDDPRSLDNNGPNVQFRLGLGCAQLLRLPRRRDRQRLLHAAFDAGLHHYDAARMYGLGMAEGEIGRFGRGRRDQISIATKFGIDPPSAAMARLQAPARAVLARAPALRRSVKRHDTAFSSGGDYSPSKARASLERSLTELGTDYVDFYFVHDPGAVESEAAIALGAELEALRAEGKVRRWGVSGEPEPALRLAAEWPDAQIQWREDVFTPAADGSVEPPPISFGVLSAAMPRIAAHLADPAERRRWSEAIGVDCADPGALADVLLREALDRNSRGAVLFATTKPERLRGAVAAAEDPLAGDADLHAFRRLAGELAGRTGTDRGPIEAEVAVVGAGPAGIIVALELARHGHDVALVESGGREPDAEAQRLGDTVGGDPLHVEMELATSRRLGGASNMWGGRCVPFDPVDFEPRPGVDAAWPLDYGEVSAYFGRACDWCLCGEPVFDAGEVPELADRAIVPGFRDGEVRASELERWSLPTNFGAVYAAEIDARPNLRLLTAKTCTEVVPREGGSEHGDRSVSHLVLRDRAGAASELRARRYVIAAGGLESTRLLLASRSQDPDGIGAHSGHLGRWYMAHVEARVGRVRFDGDPERTLYAHERDRDGVYVRRRFTIEPETQAAEGLPNVAMWMVNPEIADPSHGSAVLSFVYLMLISPLGGRFVAEGIRRAHTGGKRADVRAHLRNVARDLPRAARFAVSFGWARFLRRGRKVPAFYVPSAANAYPLLYHAEHLPHRESEVTLSEERDALGVPRLRTRLYFSDADVDAVRRAHQVVDRSLRAQGLGEVEFIHEDVEAAVREQLLGGYHQAGTTRMSADPGDGVLDRDLAVHGFSDLFVASCSAFPTSGQANSTFMLTAFAVRLADHLDAELASTGAESVGVEVAS